MDRPLQRLLDLHLPWCELAHYPSPVEALPAGLLGPASGRVEGFLKRDDLTSPVYGGNKVRSLELLLADARSRGAQVVYATGASDSNHVLAAMLHAPRVKLRPRAIVFQHAAGAVPNETALLIRARAERLVSVQHWSLVPAAQALERQRARAEAAVFLPPSGASPLGALGHVSAALELGEQIEAKAAPAPDTVVVGLGSGGTAAGLLLGFWLAARLGIGWTTPPRLVAVRIAPRPLASRTRVVALARRTARLLTLGAQGLESIPHAPELSRHLAVEGRELGAGYGHPTASGRQAAERWLAAGLPPLDLTYGGKIVAGFLRHASEAERGKLLLWVTKSSTPLPSP